MSIMPCRLQSSENVGGNAQDCSSRSALSAHPLLSPRSCHSRTAARVTGVTGVVTRVTGADGRRGWQGGRRDDNSSGRELRSTCGAQGGFSDDAIIGSGENLRGMVSYGRRIRMRREMGKKRAADVEKHEKLWVGRYCNGGA